MISWKAREASACEAHAARRYNLSSLRPQDQATYQSCAMLGLPRGHTVSGALDHKPRKAVLHSGRLEEAPFMAGPGPRTHRRPENSRWRFWTGAAGRWELLSERGTPPLGQASHTPRRQSWPWSSWGGVAGSPRRWPPLVFSVTCSADSDAVGRGRLAAASFDKEGQHRTTGTEGWACKAANSCSYELAQGRVRFTSSPAEQARSAVRQLCSGRMAT